MKNIIEKYGRFIPLIIMLSLGGIIGSEYLEYNAEYKEANSNFKEAAGVENEYDIYMNGYLIERGSACMEVPKTEEEQNKFSVKALNPYKFNLDVDHMNKKIIINNKK